MKEPKNQHQLVLWYLYNYDKIDLKFVINDSMFFKMQSRLSEIERDHGIIAIRERENFTNRFGSKSSFLTYEAKNKDILVELYPLY